MRYSFQKAHPWHGVPIGENAPNIVTAFIEMVPTDTVKYEIDKETGYLKIDRPQLFSSVIPCLYGFVPQTFCGEQIAKFATDQSGKLVTEGDGDPLDICVLTEKEIPHGDIILQAIPIGGIRLIDKGEADDKIIAVLKSDALHGTWQDITDCPEPVLKRLMHYFLTYKNIPGEVQIHVEINEVYGRAVAQEVIRKSREDYRNLIALPAI